MTKNNVDAGSFERSVERLDFFSRKARLLHKLQLCEQYLRTQAGMERRRLELLQLAYSVQLELMEEP